MIENMYIIAEMAWSHDGSLDKAVKIMEGAKRAGADAISIHVTNMETYMVPYYGSGKGKVSAGKEDRKIFEYLCEINLSENEWVEFAKLAAQNDIDLVVMPNDIESVKFTVEKLNPTKIVLASAAFVEKSLLEAVISSGKPLILRVGGATIGEIEYVVNMIRASEPNREITLLYGHQNYPTKTSDNHIGVLAGLKHMFNCKIGLADHQDADDPFALLIPCLAKVLGAEVIEKHITFDRQEKGEDFESALNEGEFKQMVDFLEKTGRAVGEGMWPSTSESLAQYRQVVRKKAIYRENLSKGKELKKSDIIFMRSDVGIMPDELPVFLGRCLLRDTQGGEPVKKEDFI